MRVSSVDESTPNNENEEDIAMANVLEHESSISA
jgi:hypothetical protein